MLRIRDVYPGSRILIFTQPDPGSKTATKDRCGKKLVVITFLVATNFTKLQIILVLKCWRKKFGPIFKEFQNFLPKKFSISSQKYGYWDPGSGKNLFRIPEPGVKRHRIPDPDPQHWQQLLNNLSSLDIYRNRVAEHSELDKLMSLDV